MIKGWYDVNGNRYHSKLEALLAANNNCSLIKYYWMPEFWKNIDYTLEPIISWETLMKNRCQELRSKHDWLQLFFSGGWDSTAVLDSFAKNHIPLDEIIIFNRTYVDDPEIPSAMEYALKIKNSTMPRVKITVIDVEHNFGDYFFHEHNDRWIISPGINMKFTRLMDRINIFRYSKKYIDSIKKYKNPGLIEGRDKPKVLCRDRCWYGFFIDSNTIETSMTPIIDFFYDEKLHIKQTHMACRWFESRSEFQADVDFVHRVQNHQVGGDVYRDYNVAIGRICTNNTHAMHGAMKKWNENNTNALQSYKISQHEKSLNSLSWKLYINGIKQIQELTKIDLMQAQLPDFITQQYYVRPVEKTNYHEGRL